MRNNCFCPPSNAAVAPLSRLVSEILGEPAATPLSRPIGALALDVSEDDQSLIVRASVPGIARENIELQVAEGVLTISASHADEKVTTTERSLRRERRTGAFTRSVTLPQDVRGQETSAELKDGVLTVRIPKTEQSQPRKITIN